MATRVTDSLEKFDSKVESIGAYLERVENYFLANDVQEDWKVAVFLNTTGRDTYSLLRNLLAPKKLSEQTLKTLTDTLKKHFEPQKVVIAEHFHFYQRNQLAGESISVYVAALRKLATHCV